MGTLHRAEHRDSRAYLLCKTPSARVGFPFGPCDPNPPLNREGWGLNKAKISAARSNERQPEALKCFCPGGGRAQGTISRAGLPLPCPAKGRVSPCAPPHRWVRFPRRCGGSISMTPNGVIPRRICSILHGFSRPNTQIDISKEMFEAKTSVPTSGLGGLHKPNEAERGDEKGGNWLLCHTRPYPPQLNQRPQ